MKIKRLKSRSNDKLLLEISTQSKRSKLSGLNLHNVLALHSEESAGQQDFRSERGLL